MRTGLGFATLVAMVGLSLPAPASACGGFFCNSAGPTSQAGEDIVFAQEGGGTMTVYIRINYAGPADRFSWILPLPALPTDLDVGPEELFDALDFATGPSFQLSTETVGTCATEPTCPRPDAGWGRVSDGSVVFSDAAASPGPTIHLREEVGPYDAVVLGGGADEVVMWLTDNGFDVAPGSEPLLREYAAAGHIFVAIRLLSDRDAGEIRPLVLHYAEANPCVPLRLTAIATVPDMPIRLYFLGASRAVPRNYTLLEPDFGQAGLWTGALSYRDYISRLADDAGGQAFVTDYAGVTPVIAIEGSSIAHLAAETDPSAFVRGLGDAGYRGDSVLIPLLRRFLPAPEGSDETSYWNCLASPFGGSAESCGFTGELDAAAFVAAFDEEVRRPRAEAQAMVRRHGHLTRLFTTMSAEEMTVDPVFTYDDGVEQTVSRVHVASRVTECSSDYYVGYAPTHLNLPNGTSAPLSSGRRFETPDQFCDATAPGWRETGMVPGLEGRPAMPAPLAGGGGICSAAPGSGRGALPALSLLAVLMLALRRRRGLDGMTRST